MTPRSFSAPVRRWFERHFEQPTAIQQQAWPAVARGDCAVIAAPTGSGKSLAAWLPLLDSLCRQPGGGLRVLYISPLRALSRDMAASLLTSVDGLASLEPAGTGPTLPRVALRTGDTSGAERRAQRDHPPDILMTTPESLFVMLGHAGSRRLLQGVEAVIVDEIHTLVESRRGIHLTLSLERLEALAGRPLQRIGISATVSPPEAAGRFLCGPERCFETARVDGGEPLMHLELPESGAGHFPDGRHWAFITRRIGELATGGARVLVFCNTRATVEKLARLLCESLGEAPVAVHHGSLGLARRREVEHGLKHGRLRVVVSSASLELGIDIGELDCVCQIGATGRAHLLRQRAGRSRHRPGQQPVVHVFPLDCSNYLEAAALETMLAGQRREPLQPCTPADDVLAQQIVTMVAAEQASIAVIEQTLACAAPWHELEPGRIEAVVDMLHQGFVPGRETARGLVVRHGRNGLAARPDAGRIARLNAGTIPEWFEYRVIERGSDRPLGRLDEEFAFESSPGQVIQLGGASWRIERIVPGQVEVSAAADDTPVVPFWLGEGPGRSDALSAQVQQLLEAGEEQWRRWPELATFLGETRKRPGNLPGSARVLVERCFDPAGDQHLIIHSLFGVRINRAWGLALRKRFCRRFNFELQAAATDNAVLISLGASHSFALPEVVTWLSAADVRAVLVQALLDTPVFQTRFRWCATTALAIPRRARRGRVPAQIQRSQTENLIARVFPDQLACLENLAGERDIPDHPLVGQALADCLHEYMDVRGLETLLGYIEDGRIKVCCRDTGQPSPLAEAVIHAPRHGFLDPAPAEERRTRSFESAARPGRRPEAARGDDPRRNLAMQCWLRAASPGELETALARAGYVTAGEGESGISATGARHAGGGWQAAFRALMQRGAAGALRLDSERVVWVAWQRLGEALAVWPEATVRPFIAADARPRADCDRDEALCRLLLARVRVLGAPSSTQLSAETGLDRGEVMAALGRLAVEGILCRGEDGERDEFWFERGPAAQRAGLRPAPVYST